MRFMGFFVGRGKCFFYDLIDGGFGLQIGRLEALAFGKSVSDFGG
jgi:hypothetical protein